MVLIENVSSADMNISVRMFIANPSNCKEFVTEHPIKKIFYNFNSFLGGNLSWFHRFHPWALEYCTILTSCQDPGHAYLELIVINSSIDRVNMLLLTLQLVYMYIHIDTALHIGHLHINYNIQRFNFNMSRCRITYNVQSWL